MKRFYVEITSRGAVLVAEVEPHAQPHQLKPQPIAHIYLNAQDEKQAKIKAMGRLHLNVLPRNVPNCCVSLVLIWCVQ